MGGGGEPVRDDCSAFDEMAPLLSSRTSCVDTGVCLIENIFPTPVVLFLLRLLDIFYLSQRTPTPYLIINQSLYYYDGGRWD